MNADRAMLYASYAQACLKAAAILPDRDARVVHREMAAEWLKFAEQDATSDVALDDNQSPRAKVKVR